MVDVEDAIRDAGAEILWVLEADTAREPGTAQSCYDFMSAESRVGWCVGDGETRPDAGEFDASPFSENRGFDILVRRETMRIEYSTSHGSPAGNDNPDGAEILAEVRALLDGG